MNISKSNSLFLFIDIDGTLIPNAPRPANSEGIKKFRQLVQDLDAILIYPTGRNFEMACEAIGEFFLPRPDFLITDNGAAMYFKNKEEWEENAGYREFLTNNNPNFDREKIAKILSKLPYLQEQEISKQHKLKASFYTDLEKQPVETVRAVKTIMQDREIDNIRITYSQDLRNNVGILEILSDNISKLTGIKYLLNNFSFCHSEEAIATKESLKHCLASKIKLKRSLLSINHRDGKIVIFAGDEGNDLDVFASGIPSILVGNAREDIKIAVRNMRLDSVYFAEKNEIEGILEGIEKLAY